MSDVTDSSKLLDLTAQIVSAHVGHNNVVADALPSLIQTVHRALADVGKVAAEPEKREPAVAIKKSVFPDRIICLDCGKEFKTLKRHIDADHGLSMEQYRERWGLPASYPTVAAEYAAQRSKLAKSFGLGRKAKAPAIEPAPKKMAGRATKAKAKVPVTTAKRGRPKKAA